MTAAAQFGTIKIGTIVRQKWDDGSMGFAEVIGFHNDSAWVLYAKVDCYRSHLLTDLEVVQIVQPGAIV
jgi:hypothetical protein